MTFSIAAAIIIMKLDATLTSLALFASLPAAVSGADQSLRGLGKPSDYCVEVQSGKFIDVTADDLDDYLPNPSDRKDMTVRPGECSRYAKSLCKGVEATEGYIGCTTFGYCCGSSSSVDCSGARGSAYAF